MSRAPAPPSIDEWSLTLLDVLDRQARVARCLESCAERQATLVAAGDTIGLLTLLAERQRLLEAFTRVQTELEPLTEGLEVLLPVADEAMRDQVESLLRVIERALERVMVRDDEDQRRLGRRSESGAETRRFDARAGGSID